MTLRGSKPTSSMGEEKKKKVGGGGGPGRRFIIAPTWLEDGQGGSWGGGKKENVGPKVAKAIHWKTKEKTGRRLLPENLKKPFVGGKKV